jgi:hypothetical protein
VLGMHRAVQILVVAAALLVIIVPRIVKRMYGQIA